MRNLLLILSFLCCTAYFCGAQPGDRGNRFQRIESLKAAYITQQLQLTVAEAEKFWPVYNQYLSEIKAAKQAHLSDELAFDEAALQVRKNYRSQFSKLLNSEPRANQVFALERNFRAVLRKELEKRQQMRTGGFKPPREQTF